jgi:hypothetical protein
MSNYPSPQEKALQERNQLGFVGDSIPSRLKVTVPESYFVQIPAQVKFPSTFVVYNQAAKEEKVNQIAMILTGMTVFAAKDILDKVTKRIEHYALIPETPYDIYERAELARLFQLPEKELPK